MVQVVLRQQEHAKRLLAEGKLVQRHHLVGAHGGAWIYGKLPILIAGRPL